ncbi:MAG: sigma-70 family RNA polymerase sigma factor [Candidatus Competibacteraceae bacterium]|nr:sigma-70 family RNA polymerase sigma factor [Candidatus Competibacteraceae bacterium]
MRKLQLLDDQHLVVNFTNGCQQSFNQLLNRHKQKVYAFIMMKVKDPDVAEDIFQDTFIKVVNTLKGGKYQEEGRFASWLMRIAHNLVIDYFRRAKRMPSFEAGGNDDDDFDVFSIIRIPDTNIEDQLIKQQTHEQLHKLIAKLPKEQKEVLFMRLYADMSFQEIADQTKVSINTALGRMRYAIINLRKLMEENKLYVSMSA